MDERNVTLQDTVSRLKEDLHSSDSRRSNLEHELRHLQTELGDAQRKLSVAQASAEVTNRVGYLRAVNSTIVSGQVPGITYFIVSAAAINSLMQSLFVIPFNLWWEMYKMSTFNNIAVSSYC